MYQGSSFTKMVSMKNRSTATKIAYQLYEIPVLIHRYEVRTEVVWIETALMSATMDIVSLRRVYAYVESRTH